MTLDAYHAQLAEIRARFAARIAGRVARLRELQAGVAAGTGGADALDELHRTLHDIAGTGPSLGFEALGAEARRLENIIAAAVKQARALSAAELADLDGGLRLLAEQAAPADAPASIND